MLLQFMILQTYHYDFTSLVNMPLLTPRCVYKFFRLKYSHFLPRPLSSCYMHPNKHSGGGRLRGRGYERRQVRATHAVAGCTCRRERRLEDADMGDGVASGMGLSGGGWWMHARATSTAGGPGVSSAGKWSKMREGE